MVDQYDVLFLIGTIKSFLWILLTLAGLLFIDAWGALRHASNVAFVCLEASMIESSSIDTNKFQQMALDQIHYTLGIKYKNNIV